MWEVVADASDVAGAVSEGFEREVEVLCEEGRVDRADEERFESGGVLVACTLGDEHVLAEVGADDEERAAVVDFLLGSCEVRDLLSLCGIGDLDDAVGLDGGRGRGGLSSNHRGFDVGFGDRLVLELADRAVGEHGFNRGILGHIEG